MPIIRHDVHGDGSGCAVTVDRTTTGDTSAEVAEEPPASERHAPPDDPGADGAPSRADSRAGAAAANEKRDDGSPKSEQLAGGQEGAAVKDEPEPATDPTESPSEGTEDSEPATDTVNTSAEATDTGQSSDDGPGDNDETGQDPAAEGRALDSDEVDAPGTDDQAAEKSQDASLSARDARRAVIDQSPDEDEPAADDPPEAVAPARGAKDQTPRAEVSDDRSNAVQPAGERESHESILAANGEQGAPPRPEGPGSFDAADRAVVAEDGSWEWKGLALTPEDNAVADSAVEARRVAEGRDSNGEYGEQGLTPQIRGVEQELAYGELVPDTEKYAVKGEDRFKEKLAKKIALEPDKSTAELAAEIHDGIRYTFTFPDEKYTDGVYDAEEKLRLRGYELRQRKPSWGDSDYKGVNSRWGDPGSGVLFEVQFHTPESWEAKQKTHDAYAMIENPDSSDADKAAARKYQQEVSAAIPVPEGADEIPRYPDERH
jgi:hypothetical protein